MLLLLFAFQLHAREIWLKVGEVRRLPASPEAQVRIGTRGVIRAVDSDDGLRVIGLKPGATSLAVDGESHMVRVSHSAQKEFLLEMRRALSEMMGLKLDTDQKILQVRGTLIRFEDWLRLARIARRYHGEYVFRAQAIPEVAPEALEYFSRLAREQGFPVVRFSAEPQFTLHLPKAVRGLKSSVERAFAPFGIGVSVAESDLALAPLIRTRVVLAEVSKSFAQEFGIQWPSGYQAQLLPKFKGDESLMLQLRALEASGQAQILASPTLLCRSGGKAHFHAGGEFPIRISSRNNNSVMWKPHGVLLNVRPKADFQGAMSVEIETEVSLLDMANSVDGVPALKKNRVHSHFDLPGKRTIALSGLIRQELGRSQEGLPVLSNIPILGALFSSKKFMNHQSELVVFVTPEIHTPLADEKIQMPEGWVDHER